MRRIFTERARLVIYLENADLVRLTAKAKQAGEPLPEWARQIVLKALKNGERAGRQGAGLLNQSPKGEAGSTPALSAMEGAAERSATGLETQGVSDDGRSTRPPSANNMVETTIARKTGHELGCACVECGRLRKMFTVKEPKNDRKSDEQHSGAAPAVSGS